MGGSGGRGWYQGPPAGASTGARLDKAVAAAAETSEYEAQSNAYLQNLLSSYNDRDAGAIQMHVQALQSALETDIDGEVATLFGGSVRKHTYVDGLSDVDLLVVVNESSLADRSPQAVLRYFETCVKDTLPNAYVKAGTLAVTVKYSDGTELQLLPAIRTSTGVRIASADGTGWSHVVRPQAFARKLTDVNQSCGRKVVPVVKLFKGLQDSLPETNKIKGYHAESLAIEAFKNYAGRQTYKDMLLHFIRNSASRVLNPIQDTSGQSLHVDDYLGAASSADRMRVSRSLDRLGNRLATADSRASLDDVANLFGD